jgi:PEP-CTERM motif
MRQTIFALTLAILCLAPSVAHASIIVQTATFLGQAHGSQFQLYDQFNPALGTLTSVTFAGTWTSSESWEVLSNFSPAITVNLTESYFGFTDMGHASTQKVESVTLQPDFFDYVTLTVGQTGVTNTLTGDFTGSEFLGTGKLIPGQFAGLSGGSVTSDTPGIYIDDPIGTTTSGTETITYTYLAGVFLPPPAAVPEPATMIGMAIGLVAMGVRRWRRRAA